MLIYEDGPWLLLRKARERLGVLHDEEGTPFSWPDGSVLACLGCLSVWMAVLLWLLPRGVAAVLAVSAVAILLQNIQERVTR